MRPFTVAQAAMTAEVSPAAIRKWLQRGHIHRDANGRIDPAELLRYLDGRGGRGIRKSTRQMALKRASCVRSA
ncbi:MAG: hypothetical protein ACRDZO_27995 [Egibacteraceae bacterium]